MNPLSMLIYSSKKMILAVPCPLNSPNNVGCNSPEVDSSPSHVVFHSPNYHFSPCHAVYHSLANNSLLCLILHRANIYSQAVLHAEVSFRPSLPHVNGRALNTCQKIPDLTRWRLIPC